jgi:transposase, IS5 family
MLRTRNDQRTLWDAIIPPELLELPEQLAKVDRLLDDERFFAAFVPHVHATEGRPSIPVETCLRLMFLKYRYRLGYEPLVAEVADSLTWRRFCRIPLGVRVPHPTTLMKITTRCGPEAVEQLNDTLLAQAAEAKLVRMHKLRTDTTVIEADVAYPTDSGLLAKAITRISASVRKVKAAGGAKRISTRDRSRSAGKRARSIAANLKRRTGEATDEVRRITGDLADLAGTAAGEAERVMTNAKRALRRQGSTASGKLARAVAGLETLLERTGKIIDQTRTRLTDDTPPGASRLVSLHDPDARPIVKGRLGKPVEFGYKAQITDNADGLVLDYDVHIGNPPDADLIVLAIERVVRRVGKVPGQGPHCERCAEVCAGRCNECGLIGRSVYRMLRNPLMETGRPRCLQGRAGPGGERVPLLADWFTCYRPQLCRATPGVVVTPTARGVSARGVKAAPTAYWSGKGPPRTGLSILSRSSLSPTRSW